MCDRGLSRGLSRRRRRRQEQITSAGEGGGQQGGPDETRRGERYRYDMNNLLMGSSSLGATNCYVSCLRPWFVFVFANGMLGQRPYANSCWAMLYVRHGNSASGPRCARRWVRQNDRRPHAVICVVAESVPIRRAPGNRQRRSCFVLPAKPPLPRAATLLRDTRWTRLRARNYRQPLRVRRQTVHGAKCVSSFRGPSG